MGDDPPSVDKPEGTINFGNDVGNAEGTSVVDKDSRNWAAFAHLSGILAGVLSGYTLCFLGPFLIWMFKKDDSEFICDQAVEALNFQITVAIAYAVIVAVVAGTCFLFYPLLLLLPVLATCHVILSIIAALKSSDGEKYRYSFNLRFIR